MNCKAITEITTLLKSVPEQLTLTSNVRCVCIVCLYAVTLAIANSEIVVFFVRTLLRDVMDAENLTIFLHFLSCECFAYISLM